MDDSMDEDKGKETPPGDMSRPKILSNLGGKFFRFHFACVD
jgi:hypothetical protein